MARALMGLIRDRNGTWCVQRKVPERLQIAVARVLNSGKARQVHLKKSLGTKDLKAANIRATSVIASFDRTIASAMVVAAQATAPMLQRQSLNGAEIARMAEALYGRSWLTMRRSGSVVGPSLPRGSSGYAATRSQTSKSPIQ